MMEQTIVEKIAQAHMAEGPNRPLRAGDFLSIRPYHVMTHDNTSAVMKKFKAIGAKNVHDPAQPVFTADHDIQNQEESNLAKYRSMEAFAREQGIDFYPPGTGIGHQIMVEKGYVLPGTSLSPPIRTPTCMARWVRSARRWFAPTPPQSGRQVSSGGRFRELFRWCLKASSRRARPAKT